MLHGIVCYACDKSVTIVTKFPFTGGSLGDICDLLVQHADSLLRPHFSRYQEKHTVGEQLGHVVGTGKISRSADKCVARKLWVVIWVVDDCITCILGVLYLFLTGGNTDKLISAIPIPTFIKSHLV